MMSFKLHDLRSIAEISSRGRGSVDPSSWRYCEQFDVVAGSLQCQIDEFIRGNWEPEAGPVRVSIPVDMRFSGEVVFLDRGNMPDAGLKTGQLLNWLVVQRSIEPVCIQRDHLRLTGGRGWRVMSIPEDCGGGVIYERPDAPRATRRRSAPADAEQSLDASAWPSTQAHRAVDAASGTTIGHASTATGDSTLTSTQTSSGGE